MSGLQRKTPLQDRTTVSSLNTQEVLCSFLGWIQKVAGAGGLGPGTRCAR